MRRGSVHLLGVVLVALVLVGVVLFNVLRDRTDQALTQVPALTDSLVVLTSIVQQLLTSSFTAAVVSQDDVREGFIAQVSTRELGLESTNVYGLVRSGSFVITPVTEGWELQIKGIFVRVQEGASSVQRTFDAIIVVNEQGILVRNIYK